MDIKRRFIFMANNDTNESNISQILQAIIDGSTDYPEFKDNPPSKISTLLMELGEKIGYEDGTEVEY
jgi:hypothetical protein